ncbi:MAG: hypothetical protein ABSB68_04465 [Acidimicrobiales bacterium]|jgi:hypothetical protein
MDMSVQEIAEMSDPVLRNLLITQRYHEFALQLRDAGAGEDATWCAFAVWASKTAGASIRGEVLPAKAKQLMTENGPAQEVLHRFNHGVTGWAWKHLTHDHIGQVVDDVTADVSKQIAEGNVLVFAELAPLFTALIDACRSSPRTSQELAAAFAPSLAPLTSDPDGVAVVAAFEAYERALFDPSARPALMLRANTLAVAHEQRRLQPAIAAALDAAISDTLRKVIEQDVVKHLPTAEVRHVLGALTGDVCAVLDEAWDTALTEAIMQLVTPSETLDLRRDVPPLSGGMFPPELRDLAGTEAESAVAQWDRTHGKGIPSGAHDWARLEDRMNFIVNLFRSRQRDPNLFNPPFTDGQLAALAQGRLPPGPL